jgi:hypothetical protein
MNKEKTLQALEEARDLHIEQMYVIEDYFNGEGVDDPISMDDAENDFREIFYGHKEEISHILGVQFYKKLDQLHRDWHLQYEKIDKIFFRKKRGGFFARFFSKHKVSYGEHQLAKRYYHELKEITGEILYLFDASMRRVAALNDSKFEN